MLRATDAVGVALIALSVSCGSGGPSISDEVARRLETAVEVESSDVTCPGDASMEPGVEFECDATIAGQELSVGVVVGEGDDLDVTPLGRVLPTAEVEALIADDAEALIGVSVTIDCGEEDVVVINSGESLDCSARSADGTSGLAQVALDANGEPELVNLAAG